MIMKKLPSLLGLLLMITTVSMLGISIVVGALIYYHPYFNPLIKPQLPRGWVDEYTYVSSSFTLKDGETIRDIFQYGGRGGQSMLIFAVQPLIVEKKGSIFIVFNDIPLGETYIETTLAVNTSIASCCFVTLIQAGTDNIVEITSHGFEGALRYIIVLPTR